VAGRPSLRIRTHGKIRREYLGGGVWLAFWRFRDADGVTRRVQRVGPADEHDKRGKLAEDGRSPAGQVSRAPAASRHPGATTFTAPPPAKI
jgi:hypothetical protein